MTKKVKIALSRPGEDIEIETDIDGSGNLKPIVYLGQCSEGKCGEEAACRPSTNSTFTCICPHDSSAPTIDLKCPNRATVPLTPRPIHNIIPPSEINITDSNITHGVLQHSGSSPFKSYFEEVSKKPAFVIVSIVVLCCVSILGLLLCCFLRRCANNKKIRKMSPLATLQKMASLHSLQKSTAVPDKYKDNPNYSIYSSSVPLIQRSSLRFLQEIGQGCFGKVFKGEYVKRETDYMETVAIKVLKETASRETEEDFMREVEIMSSFKHKNILSLVGVVVRESDQLSPMMVFEYMAHGDLAEVLREKKYEEFVTHETLLSMALQIAYGMQYLSVQRFVHRDLACRNCLVSDGFVVKIADFGMSRDIYTCDYYKMGGSRLLPVRWMSPESVMYGRFTFESDIWSYGVVLWEIYSLGKQPYFGFTNEQVLKLVLQGVRLEAPEDCPAFIVELMQFCWKLEPKERLKFPEIVKYLISCNNGEVSEQMSSYLPRPPSFSVSVLDENDVEEERVDGSSEMEVQGYLVPKDIEDQTDYFLPI